MRGFESRRMHFFLLFGLSCTFVALIVLEIRSLEVGAFLQCRIFSSLDFFVRVCFFLVVAHTARYFLCAIFFDGDKNSWG